MAQFHLRINGGEEKTLTVKSGVYLYAVAAVPARFDVGPPLDVEIWCPRFLPTYGPYFYRIEDNGSGLKIVQLVKRP